MRSRRLAAILLGLIVSGCAVPAMVRPPLAKIPAERPAVIDRDDRLTDQGVVWINQVLEAYRLNCVALSTLRGEDVAQCEAGLR